MGRCWYQFVAIHKPQSLSSAQVVRDIQAAFTRSNLFASSLAIEKASRDRLSAFQKKRRKDKSLKVKVGHGGTLDPLATGVLIIGVGTGTKSLQRYLGCTKTYEVDLLFGAATDTYDILGKVLNKASYAHLTRDTIEKKLAHFRGNIMQRPPIYSALRVQGKHLYEYAREGKEVPIEIQERPVTVHTLEVTNWLEDHPYEWPKEEAVALEKGVGEQFLHLQKVLISEKADSSSETTEVDHILSAGLLKRKRSQDTLDGVVETDQPATHPPNKMIVDPPLRADKKHSAMVDDAGLGIKGNLPVLPTSTKSKPPVVTLRMTVSSGFYVRSLCHDLGLAAGSLGIMARLVRSRQGNFELDKNVLDYGKLGSGEDSWRPEVEDMLYEWSQTQRKAAGSEEIEQ